MNKYIDRVAYNPWDKSQPTFPDCKDKEPKPSSENDPEWAAAREQKAKWKEYMANLKPYDPKANGIVPGTRGIVFTAPSNWIRSMIRTVLILRDLGCDLPVELAYVDGEVTEKDLAFVKSMGITPVNLTPYVQAENWEGKHKSLGASKVFAILHSSFEEVLFLDPDNIPVRDPTELFDSPEFKTYGSLYWPDFFKSGHDNKIFWIMDICHRNEMDFESGQVLVNKRLAWKGLSMAKHMAKEAKFYFEMMWGDKDTFHYGYKASKTPYAISPYFITNLGSLVSEAVPKGGVPLTPDNKFPTNTTFCGQSMLQYDFKGRSMFAHANGVKYTYFPGTAPFEIALNYQIPEGKLILDYDHFWFEWIGSAGEQEHCIALKDTDQLKLKIWNWTDEHLLFNEKFEAADKKATLFKQLAEGKPI
ncbi:hypothetical protein HDU76_009649, partial [Blyttiomyces sp. JEL0837]